MTLCVLTGRSGGSRGFCDRALYAFSVFLVLFLVLQLLVGLCYWGITTWARNKRREGTDDYGKPPTRDLVL